ncbi:MAG: bifunctional 3-deoxy-7-phosphoheptulonate synthase/chorismate mutase [Chthoniobacterales bacterium]
MSTSLDSLRTRLDALDRRLIDDLAERQRVVTEVATLKNDPALPLRDAERERELLARVSALASEQGLDSYFVESLYRGILEHSVRYQAARQSNNAAAAALNVAYQGVEGSYSHSAARSHFAATQGEVQLHGYRSFASALDAVTRCEAEVAFLPIENSLTGSIVETYDLLSRANLHLIGEEVHRVKHCLLALKPVPLGLIRRVGSHPQALAQCSIFLDGLSDCRVEIEDDTASAAMLVAESGDLSRGSIASEEAAARYGLQIIKRNIANQKENYTRFVAVAREARVADHRLPHKTSLLLTTAHEKGALARCLTTLAEHGVNLTKLESRPSLERPWQYLFYLDHEGGFHEPHVKEAHVELAKHAQAVRILGVYPRWGAHPPRVHFSAPPPKSEEPLVAKEAKPTAMASNGNSAYRLASRANHTADTVIEIGHVHIGGDSPFAMIAGPCSVESREQISACARAVCDAGGGLLRGGCFKPRTSRYDFQGLGFDALTLLHEAGHAYNLRIVTEVLHPADVDAVAREADVLQIGARNMQNFALLKAVGKSRLPVLLKRGLMSSIDEWLAAAEYIMGEGNTRVILCERGIRTFETATRNTLDLSAVVVLRERTHLPVIVDPSHAVGKRDWVGPLAHASRAVGAHGVMIEIHPDPEHALSDGPQSLDLEQFNVLSRTLTG